MRQIDRQLRSRYARETVAREEAQEKQRNIRNGYLSRLIRDLEATQVVSVNGFEP